MDPEIEESSPEDTPQSSGGEDTDDEEWSNGKTRRRSKRAKGPKPDRLNGEYSYQNTIKQRVIGQPCLDCKMDCDRRMAERFRQDNYLKFWGKLKSWEDRRTHIRQLMQVIRVPHPTKETRKKFLRKYYLEMEDGYILVCKTMFFNTLAISAKFIETTLQKYPENTIEESKMKLINNPNILNKSLDTSKSTKTYTPKKPPPPIEATTTKQKIDKPNNEQEQVVKEEVPLEGKPLEIENKKDMKPPCSCPEQCSTKISEETRCKIYEHFWLKLKSWDERKLFIINTIEKDRYTSSRCFVLPMKDEGHITVCQEMYLNTLSLNEESIDPLLPKSEPIKIMKRKYTMSEYPRLIKSPEQQSTTIIPQLINNSTISNSIIVKQQQEIPKDIINTKVQLPAVKRPAKLEFTPLKPPCSCHMQCRLKLTEDIREQIHREFWNLPAQVDKKHFILSTLQVQIYRNKVTKEKGHEIKHYMLPFHYDSVVVCKEMYLHTLTVSDDFISRTIKNINHDGSIVEDEENCDDPPPIVKDPVQNEPSGMQGVRRKRSRNDKRMGPPCPPSCRLKCSTKFTEEDRMALHEKFWYNMDWQERKQFVMNTVKEFPIKNRSIPGRQTKRNFSRIYTLPNKDDKITVCQKMYFNTLSICSKFVSTVHIWASQVKW